MARSAISLDCSIRCNGNNSRPSPREREGVATRDYIIMCVDGAEKSNNRASCSETVRPIVGD